MSTGSMRTSSRLMSPWRMVAYFGRYRGWARRSTNSSTDDDTVLWLLPRNELSRRGRWVGSDQGPAFWKEGRV